MRGFVGWIVLGAIACLACGLQAEEQVGGSLATAPPPLPGIGSHDPRIRVDPDVGPWRAVGKLQAASIDFRTLCTATLVGPSTVVTAAHCLFNRRVQRYFQPESLHFLIGYTGNRYAGHAIAISVKTGDGYDPGRPRETIGSDWALVSLEQSLGSPDRILPILSRGGPPKNGENVMLGGYQRDHPLLLMADPQCQIVERSVDVSGRLVLRHNCAGTNGVSGAPLLIYRDGRWQVAAIDVAGEIGITGGGAVVVDETKGF
jgi:V8-like Glu-specific endopeptidase